MPGHLPPAGSRVRATCGESVLIGEVKDLGRGVDGDQVTYAVILLVDRCSPDRAWPTLQLDEWAFEILTPPAPPIPDVEGIRVRDCDGDEWTRDTVGWARPGVPLRKTLETLTEHFGPLVEVLAATTPTTGDTAP